MPNLIGDVIVEQHIAELHQRAADYRTAAQVSREPSALARLMRRLTGWGRRTNVPTRPSPVALWLAQPDACSVRCR